MINGKKVLGIIPARGGSKGVPGKNLYSLAGQPLINHTIIFAKKCLVFDKIIVSSDDDMICAQAEQLNVEVIKRPLRLAQDDSLVIDAIRYTLDILSENNYYPDYIFLLEPTSPFRSNEDVITAIEALENGYDSVASYCEIDPPISRIWRIVNGRVQPLIGGTDPFLPRQKQIVGYKLTGQIYAFKRHIIDNASSASILGGRIFPLLTDPLKTIDINREIDFLVAEQIIKYYEKNS